MEELEIDNFFRLAGSAEIENLLIATQIFEWAHKDQVLGYRLCSDVHSYFGFFEALHASFKTGRIGVMTDSSMSVGLACRGAVPIFSHKEVYVMIIADRYRLQITYTNTRIKEINCTFL